MRGAKQKEKIMLEISDFIRREILHLMSVCNPRGRGGDSDIFIHRAARSIFFFGGGGFKILYFNIFGGFQK